MILFIFLFILHLVSSEVCVVNEVDIYPGYLNSMTTGSIMQYGENSLLVAARDLDGYHMFSYSKDRPEDERLQIVITFSMSTSYLHVDPFFGIFKNVNAALYQVYESISTNNVALFYTYGELDDMNTFQIELDEDYGVSGVIEHKNEIYAWNSKSVYLLELEDGIATVITPDDCGYPTGMRTFFDDEIMLLLCANSTEILFSTICDYHIFNSSDKTFLKRNTGQNSCVGDMNLFTESGGLVYYSDIEGISSTNFVDQDEVLLTDVIGRTLRIGDHVFLVTVVQETFKTFKYSLLSAPDVTVLSINKPIDEYLIKDNIAYFASNCDGNVRFSDVLCMWDLDTLEVEWVEDPGNRIGISGFFLLNEALYFIASDPNFGTEIFFLDSDRNIEMAADIYRGPRSGRPTNFIFLGEDIYYISENIQVGREIFTFIEKDTCGDGTEVIYCGHGDSQCVVSTTGNVTYVGDVIVNITSIFHWTNTIEGNLFGINATLKINGTTNVLGGVILTNTSVLSVSSSDVLNVRECIDPGNGILELRLTEEEIKLGRVKVLPGLCFVGTFGLVKSEDPCQKITVLEADYNADLSITFKMQNTCTRNIIIISVSVAVVILLAIILILVIMKVRPVRQAVLPHRDRGRRNNAKRSSKRNSTEMKKVRTKRASSSSTPKKSSGTSASLA